ncbi:hypothetical protein BC829DRAFT_88331 [Chytridium lagenaria]|nr:hypothetical protein BC829DRAFT_88331 [Chytridium lagenaria]
MAYYNNNQQYNQNANYGNQYHHDQNYDYNNQYDHSGYDAYAQQPGGAYQQQQQQQYNQQQQYQQQPQQGYYDAPASATPSTRAADLPTYNNNNNNADLVPKTNWDEKKRADAGPFANNDASSFVAVKRRRCYPHRPVHWIITACVVALMVGLGVFASFTGLRSLRLPSTTLTSTLV